MVPAARERNLLRRTGVFRVVWTAGRNHAIGLQLLTLEGENRQSVLAIEEIERSAAIRAAAHGRRQRRVELKRRPLLLPAADQIQSQNTGAFSAGDRHGAVAGRRWRGEHRHVEVGELRSVESREIDSGSGEWAEEEDRAMVLQHQEPAVAGGEAGSAAVKLRDVDGEILCGFVYQTALRTVGVHEKPRLSARRGFGLGGGGRRSDFPLLADGAKAEQID